MQNFLLVAALSSTISLVQATALVVNTSSGDAYYLDVQPEDSFQGIINALQSLESHEQSDTLLISMTIKEDRIEAKTKPKPPAAPSAPRDYYALSSKDKENITYLLTTLGFQPILKINSKKSSLTKVGAQVDHVHPLRFFYFVFTNDELIASIHNIRGRSWLWKDFIGPLHDSLSKENSLGNITQAQIIDLAAAVKIDPNLIIAPSQSQDWTGFVESLLKNVQRSGDAKRYDM